VWLVTMCVILRLYMYHLDTWNRCLVMSVAGRSLWICELYINLFASAFLNNFLTMFSLFLLLSFLFLNSYLSMSKYDAAAFCCEELILHDPMNHLLHCRLAEIYYTMGPSHIATARKYESNKLYM
jgi:hypothetical protein